MGVFVHNPLWHGDFANSLWSMQQKGVLCDVSIHPAAEADKLAAHSAVLAAASPHLQRLFQSLQEGYYVLRTANITHHVWSYLLEFVYHGKVVVSEKHIDDVRRIAGKLGIKLEPNSECSENSGSGITSLDGIIVIEDDDNHLSDELRSKLFRSNQNETNPTDDCVSQNNSPSDKNEEDTKEKELNNQNGTSETDGSLQDTSATPEATSQIDPPSAKQDDQVESSSEVPNTESTSPEHTKEPTSQEFTPSIKQIIKEASSRKRKSTPRKIVKGNIMPTREESDDVHGSTFDDTPSSSPNMQPKLQVAEVRPTQSVIGLKPSPIIPASDVEPSPKLPKLDLTSTPLPVQITMPTLSEGSTQMSGDIANMMMMSQLAALNQPQVLNLIPPPAANMEGGTTTTQNNPPILPGFLPGQMPQMMFLPGMGQGQMWAHPVDNSWSAGPNRNRMSPPVDALSGSSSASFSLTEPPQGYAEFIQWTKAVRAKLRMSQTALSEKLNMDTHLTKRYSQTIISSFETFKMSEKEVAFLRPHIINILQRRAQKLGVSHT